MNGAENSKFALAPLKYALSFFLLSRKAFRDDKAPWGVRDQKGVAMSQ